MIDNNIMPTSGSREIDPITLAKIKQKSQEREYEVVDDPIGRIKLKNYTHEDSALTYEKPLNLYYCSLCGAHLLVTTSPLTGLVRRRSDQAIILSESQGIQFQDISKLEILSEFAARMESKYSIAGTVRNATFL